jgi:hypothetical protein
MRQWATLHRDGLLRLIGGLLVGLFRSHPPADATSSNCRNASRGIAATNDSAKSAQGAAFLFLPVCLYLLATAFGFSDENLLLGRTVTIAQMGASLPVSFSFAIAPMVFVFLPYALARYDTLAANMHARMSGSTACRLPAL